MTREEALAEVLDFVGTWLDVWSKEGCDQKLKQAYWVLITEAKHGQR